MMWFFGGVIGDTVLADSVSNTSVADAQCVPDDWRMDDVEPPRCEPFNSDPLYEKRFPVQGIGLNRNGVQLVVTTLYNVHTREVLPVIDRGFPADAQLQWFFRCRGFAETTTVDPRLVTTMLEAARHFEAERTTVISAFRSGKFNDSLSKKGRRVARESKHITGDALDFRLDTANAVEVGRWLQTHFDGGVGVYRNDDFVHIDTGPARRWRGR